VVEAQIERTAQERVREKGGEPVPGVEARRRLLADMPVEERRLLLAGISTAVLEGGDGPPVILLHGPMANATHWMGIIPGLAAAHRVVAPDLPGHGASEVTGEGRIDSGRVMEWLDALIEQTCQMPPALVGQLLGGALAARYAVEHSHRLNRLVLVDTFGLRPFQPAPEFGLALANFLTEPTERTHTDLWNHCAFNLDALRQRMGAGWERFEAYTSTAPARRVFRRRWPRSWSISGRRRFRRAAWHALPFQPP
jgi:pimeloyl-ACP methyl ester carboxylesterase